MLIHEVTKTTEYEFVVDPIHGHVRRPVELLKAGSTWKLSHEGVEYERDADGSFDLPPEAAAFFLRMPTWFEGPAPFAPEADEKPKPAARARKSAVKGKE